MTRAYHGTTFLFEKFNCPAYFTDDFVTAQFFAKAFGNDIERIYDCELYMKNPLIVDLHGQSWGGFFLDDEELQQKCIEFAAAGDESELEYFKQEGLTAGVLADYVQDAGFSACGFNPSHSPRYDSLIMMNCKEENDRTSTQIVMFYADDIIIKNRSDQV